MRFGFGIICDFLIAYWPEIEKNGKIYNTRIINLSFYSPKTRPRGYQNNINMIFAGHRNYSNRQLKCYLVCMKKIQYSSNDVSNLPYKATTMHWAKEECLAIAVSLSAFTKLAHFDTFPYSQQIRIIEHATNKRDTQDTHNACFPLFINLRAGIYWSTSNADGVSSFCE